MAYKKMVSIFVDILGYKNIRNFEEKHELHRLFHEEVVVHRERQQAIPHVIYDRTVFGFSDCAYFFFHYKDGVSDERKNNTNLIYIASYNVSLTILRLMSRGYLARGGVAFGDVFLDDLGFFGPAVERAHEIESKEAKFPRLQFDSGIGQQVFEWEHRMEDKDPDLLRLYSEVPFVSERDGDSYFVNPFNVLQRSGEFHVGRDLLTLEGVKSALADRIDADIKAFSDQPSIVLKLEWLRSYSAGKELLVNADATPFAVSITSG